MIYNKNTEQGHTQDVVNKNNRAENILASSCFMGGKEVLNKNAFRTPLRSGFTLIELLVVVLIIGILAAVALPQYNKAVRKSRATQALVYLQAMQKNIDMYLLENGYPNQETTEMNGDISIEQNSLWDQSAYCGPDGCLASACNLEGTMCLQLCKGSAFVGPCMEANPAPTAQNWGRACIGSTEKDYAFCESLVGQGWTPVWP